jgi:hypothetical protein
MYLVVSWYSNEGSPEFSHAKTLIELMAVLQRVSDTSAKWVVFESSGPITQISPKEGG